MTARHFTGARVREISLGVQAYIFFLIATALRTFTHVGPTDTLPRALVVPMILGLLIFPFAWARIPPLMAITPGFFLRREARVELHGAGLIYYFDGVKRPLFVDWPDLMRLERTKLGLVIETRPGAILTDAMPRYQAQFWRERTSRPIRLGYVEAFRPDTQLTPCLAAAMAAGVAVVGFEDDDPAVETGAAALRRRPAISPASSDS